MLGFAFLVVYMFVVIISWYWGVVKWLTDLRAGSREFLAWVLVGGAFSAGMVATHILTPLNSQMGTVARFGCICVVLAGCVTLFANLFHHIKARPLISFGLAEEDQAAADGPAYSFKKYTTQWLLRQCQSGAIRRTSFMVLLGPLPLSYRVFLG